MGVEFFSNNETINRAGSFLFQNGKTVYFIIIDASVKLTKVTLF